MYLWKSAVTILTMTSLLFFLLYIEAREMCNLKLMECEQVLEMVCDE